MSENLNRREFAGRTAGALLLPLAQSREPGEQQREKRPRRPDPPPLPEPAPEPVPVEVLLLGVIARDYEDKRLDEPALQGILGEIVSDRRKSRALSRYTLQNWDEPVTVFRAYRGPDRPAS